jgi:hypothetical protein
MPIVRPVSALLAQVIDARGYERETIEATIVSGGPRPTERWSQNGAIQDTRLLVIR